MALCGKCGGEKSGANCRPCKAAYMRDWLARNPAQRAKSNARRKRLFEANREHHNATCLKSYYAKHEEKKAKKRAYAAAHKTEADARRNQWAADNAAHVVENRKRRYRENRERILAENRKRLEERGEQYATARRQREALRGPEERQARHQKAYQANPAAFKQRARNRTAKLKGADGTHTRLDVRRQVVLQDGKCFWCDAVLGRKHHVDHLIPLSKGGSNGPWNLVIACVACNCSKGATLPLDWCESRRVAAQQLEKIA